MQKKTSIVAEKNRQANCVLIGAVDVQENMEEVDGGRGEAKSGTQLSHLETGINRGAIC